MLNQRHYDKQHKAYVDATYRDDRPIEKGDTEKPSLKGIIIGIIIFITVIGLAYIIFGVLFDLFL